MENKLLKRYLKLVDGEKLYPPLNNYSPFIQGSGWNTEKYFKNWYGEDISFDVEILDKADGTQEVKVNYKREIPGSEPYEINETISMADLEEIIADRK